MYAQAGFRHRLLTSFFQRPTIYFGAGHRRRPAFCRACHGVEPLEPRLVLNASIIGYVTQSNGAGGGVPGVTVFMDDNRNGVVDDGERAVLTDINGRYEFANTPEGRYNILAFPKAGWSAEKFDRLIGLGSWWDLPPALPFHGDPNIDTYAALWEIDPANGFAINSFPIVAGDGVDASDLDYAGLTAIPNCPGWYLSHTQTIGSFAWNVFADVESKLVAIHWEPGMGNAEATYLTEPGFDYSTGGGLDFDPTGDPTVFYGGMGKDWRTLDWAWSDDDWLWKRNTDEISSSATEEIGKVSLIPGDIASDLAFDGHGNLYLFVDYHRKVYSLDKTTGATLSQASIPFAIRSAEWNPESLSFWITARELDADDDEIFGTYNPADGSFTWISSGFDFGVPLGPGWDNQVYRPYRVEGLEFLADAFNDRPVNLKTTDVIGIDFSHFFHQVGIKGTIFRDANNNGYRDPGEDQGMPNERVYLDANANNRFDEGEANRWTDPFGRYEFGLLPPGIYRVALQRSPGYDTVYPDTPSTSHFVNLVAGQFYTADFGMAQTVDVRGRAFDDLNADSRHDPDLTLSHQLLAQPDVPIPDEGMVSSSVLIGTGGRLVTDVDVYLQIQHPYVSDVRAELVSPAGTRVRLFQHVGGDGDDFDLLVLDDEAITSVTTITAADTPVRGIYRPEQSLSTFDGQWADGEWTLEVFDDARADVGTLVQWTLSVTTPGPAEPGLAGVPIYVDLDRNGALNTVTAQGDSFGVVPIPDLGTASSTVQISDVGGPVADVDVYLDITHSYVADLTVDLVSPSGTRVRMIQRNGGSGQNFTGTILDDEATVSIEDASPQDNPFTGWWRPYGSLADFDGEQPDGTWTLQVSDMAAGDVGTINFWSLRMTTGDIVTTTDANGFYEFKHLPPGPLPIRQQLTHQRSATYPAPTGETVVERFEVDLSQYQQVEAGQSSTLSASAAYEGSQGLIPGRWLVGTADSPVIRKGDSVSTMLKFPQAAEGNWAWLGFGAYEGGTLAVAVNPGVTASGGQPGKLAIWQWTGGFDGPTVKTFRLTETPLGYLSPDVWYRLDVDWGLTGTITARLYNATSNPQTGWEAAAVAAWPVNEGALAFRGKLASTSPSFYFDRVAVQRSAAQTVLTSSGLTYNVNFGSAADGVIIGTVYEDNNGNGVIDGDVGLAGWQVYDDLNHNGLYDAPVYRDYGDNRNWAIDDRAATVAWFEVQNQPGVIRDVNAVVDIDHANVGDLTAWLVSPQGTRVELFNHVGGAGDNFDLTIFNDSASTSITSGIAPFSGEYRPSGRLADLNGEDPNGVWRLLVIDDVANGIEGLLDNALIGLTTGEMTTVTDANGFFVGGELPARTYQLREEHRAGWLQTAPQPMPQREVALGSGQFIWGQDFGNTRPGSVSGLVWHDHNANGTRDPGDEGLAGRTVFLDVDTNGIRDVSPPQTYSISPDAPIADLTTLTSMIYVYDAPGKVLNVNVRLDIQHTYDADLDVYLHSPQGTRLRLFEDVGSSGDNFYGTLLDDQASLSITQGSAPFTGIFRPQDPLSIFNGQNPEGVWMLEVYDDAASDVGTLLGWQVTLTTGDPATTTDAVGNYQFASVVPGVQATTLKGAPGCDSVNPSSGVNTQTILERQQPHGGGLLNQAGARGRLQW